MLLFTVKEKANKHHVWKDRWTFSIYNKCILFNSKTVLVGNYPTEIATQISLKYQRFVKSLSIQQ